MPGSGRTVGLYNETQPIGAIGRLTESGWQGMRHYGGANVRGLLYKEDRALGIWEVDTWGRPDEFAHGRLLQLFETFLIGRFPGATRIFTDDAEPAEDTERNRDMLRSLGYDHVEGTHRIFAKEVAH